MRERQVANKAQKDFAKLTGSKQFRNKFQRLMRMMYTKTMIKYPDFILNKIMVKRTNRGVFERGSKKYSRSYAVYRRVKAGLAGGRIKIRAKKEAFKQMRLSKGGRRNQPWRTFYTKWENGIREYKIRPRDIKNIKERLSGRTRNKSWKEVMGYLARRGLNPYYISSDEEATVVNMYKTYFNRRAYPIFDQDIL